MAFTQNSNQPMSDINVTPLVDVMLVLLIIFMITAPKLTQGVEVELPQASDAQAVGGDDDRLLLTLTQDGQIYIGTTEVPRDRIADILSENAKLKVDGELFLHADHRLPYGDVVAVMASAKKGGATSIAMVTDPVARVPKTKK